MGGWRGWHAFIKFTYAIVENMVEPESPAEQGPEPSAPPGGSEESGSRLPQADSGKRSDREGSEGPAEYITVSIRRSRTLVHYQRNVSPDPSDAYDHPSCVTPAFPVPAAHPRALPVA